MTHNESGFSSTPPIVLEVPIITQMGNGSVPLRHIPLLVEAAYAAIRGHAMAEQFPPTEDQDQITLATAAEFGKVAIYIPSGLSASKGGGPVYEVVMNWDASRPAVETITASLVRDWPTVCRPAVSMQ